MNSFLLNFASSCSSSCLSKIDNIKKITGNCVFELKALKVILRVLLAGHTAAMLTHCLKKIMITCLPMIEQFF